MAKDDPSPTDITLRFKHGRNTILLLVQPLTSFQKIISTLLDALRERYPLGLPSSGSPTKTQIPEYVNEVVLGTLVDRFDVKKGWNELDTGNQDITQCPKSLGLKDGDMVAFTFMGGEGKGKERERKLGESAFDVEFSSYDDNYVEE